MDAPASANLPVGTLTFLMTDVESSTRAWDASPSSAKAALERHDRIVLEQVERNQGQVVESGREGDSVLAVFRQASDAVACALDAQRSLQRANWPVDVDIRVRIAVHTGEADLRSSHYIGAPLYRCARLMAAAHGGQVLVSRATEELVADGLPDGASLRDLGPHRLRDLSRPEHVYQLLHPDLQSEFPALESLEKPHNLPLQLTTFIGRQRELDELKLALAANRLVTLTGAGGCGKTRLALQAAAEALNEYPDGAYFVDLSPVSDQSLITACVAAALSIRTGPSHPGHQPAAP
jgi:class 3 adenylate cyclase